jgi:hypothetical protein
VESLTLLIFGAREHRIFCAAANQEGTQLFAVYRRLQKMNSEILVGGVLV